MAKVNKQINKFIESIDIDIDIDIDINHTMAVNIK